jgi:hypothetical protein
MMTVVVVVVGIEVMPLYKDWLSDYDVDYDLTVVVAELSCLRVYSFYCCCCCCYKKD